MWWLGWLLWRAVHARILRELWMVGWVEGGGEGEGEGEGKGKGRESTGQHDVLAAWRGSVPGGTRVALEQGTQ